MNEWSFCPTDFSPNPNFANPLEPEAEFFQPEYILMLFHDQLTFQFNLNERSESTPKVFVWNLQRKKKF